MKHLHLLSTAFFAAALALLISPTTSHAQNPGDLLASHVEDLGGQEAYFAVTRVGDLAQGGLFFLVGNRTDFVTLETDIVVASYRLQNGAFTANPQFNNGVPIIYDFQLDPNNLDEVGRWVATDGIDTDGDGVDDDFEVYAGANVDTAGGALFTAGVAKFASDGGGGLPVPGWGTTFLGESYMCNDATGRDGVVDAAGEVFMTGSVPDNIIWEDFWTGKLLSNGDHDLVFGPNLGCQILFVPNFFEEGVAIFNYDSNKVMSVGNAYISTTDIQLVRHHKTGPLDPTFGAGGIVITPSLVLGGIGYVTDVRDSALVAHRNGGRRTVVAGNGFDPTLNREEIFLVRYHSNGIMDASLGATGFILEDFGGALPGLSAKAIAIDKNRMIVVVGNYDDGFWVARFDTAGVLDPNFGNGGWVTVVGSENVQDVVIGKGGLNIICVGDIIGDGFIYGFKG